MFSRSEMMFPANHKTVFVLDHTPYFGISCDSLIQFDFLKARGTAIIPLTPISKSLWTCSVESAIEYCRIVWDLFPHGKLVRFIVSDKMAHILNTWHAQTQNMTHIMNAMSMIGIPPRSVSGTVELSVLHGLRAAVETLSETTDQQKAYIATADKNAPKMVNRTRVICVTSARDDESMKSLEEIYHNVLIAQNKILIENENTMCIHHCHLVIINISPHTVESSVSNHPPKEISSILTTEVHSIKAPNISMKFSHLILQHYDLASTTVTGIPMKEEQNASSSANYDVEIYHASNAHIAILKGNTADTAMIKALREGFDYETVTLKWCTPRGCSTEMQNCTAMHRITPVDVNSRPSSCLINFLLNGRSVMLEMPRKAGGKIISHLLAAHGGEIFIHTLYTARSVLEDPPSISEGPGGRVTDYRITDFGAFIQNNKLLPMIRKPDDETPTPMDKMLSRLDRQTKYWPLTISSTLIFNLRNFIEPLPQLMTKDQLTDEEVVNCKQVIYNLIGLESKHEPLHLINVGHRSKGQKREEQYKILWSEIDTLLKNNCHTANHTAVYNCLLECHKFPAEDPVVKVENLPDKVELDQALRELDQIGKLEPDQPTRASVIRATTDSPMSPPPLASIAISGASLSVKNSHAYDSKSFLDIYLSMNKRKKRPEFAGRLTAEGPIAKLYPNLNFDKDRNHKPDIAAMDIDG